MLRLVLLAALVAAFVFLGPVMSSMAHSWYSEKVDPVYGQSCCGGSDCAAWQIMPGEIEAEADGYRVRLSLERSRMINPNSAAPSMPLSNGSECSRPKTVTGTCA